LKDILKIKGSIAALLGQAVSRAQQEDRLPSVELPEITIEKPQNTAHGDYASSLPLKMARAIGRNPMDIANVIMECMAPMPELESVEAARPGFINFTLDRDWLSQQVETVLAEGESFGDINMGQGQSIQIEFVSANPTGPLHVGHGRGAVLGSTLSNVLEAAGYNVQKEYYINDAGNQMSVFYRSLYTRYQQACGKDVEMPQEGYMGQ